MSVPEEIFEDRSNDLQSHIGKWKCYEVSKGYKFKWTCEYISDYKCSIRSHDFQQGKVETFSFDSDSKHVVHHYCAQQKKRKYDKFEHNSYEHSDEPQSYEICGDWHACLYRENTNFVHQSFTVLTYSCKGFFVIRIWVYFNSVIQVYSSFTWIVSKVEERRC